MWPFENFPKSILLTVQKVGIQAHTQIAIALNENRVTYSQYAAMRLPTLGALELAKLLLTERYSPLRQMKKKQLRGNDVPVGGYIVLLALLFHSLKNLMDNDSVVNKLIGISHDDLISEFCAIASFPKDELTGNITNLEEHEQAWAQTTHPEMFIGGYETTIDFCETLFSGTPEISPVKDFEFFFVLSKTHQFLFQNLRAQLEQQAEKA